MKTLFCFIQFDGLCEILGHLNLFVILISLLYRSKTIFSYPICWLYEEILFLNVLTDY